MAYGVWGSTHYQAGAKVSLKMKLYPPAAIPTPTVRTTGLLWPKVK
jgi:hypothetical protein